MAIRIITDSTADLPSGLREREQIEVVPLTVHIDGEEYRDGYDLGPKEFFEKLAVCQDMPTTSQVTVGTFLEIFERYREDEVLGIFISQKLSGTYQSACIARDSLPGQRIYLVDGASATFGLCLLVEYAAGLRAKGVSASEIAKTLEEVKARLVLYAGIDTLKYLKKGGRLSGAGAVVGTLLQVKPVISVTGGVVEVVSKARGNAAAYDWIAKTVGEEEIDPCCRPYFGHAQCPELMEKLSQKVSHATGVPEKDFGLCDVGVVIGTHAGPGCCGVAYIAKHPANRKK